MDGKTQSPPAIPHRPEPLIFERGAPGRRALDLPAPDGPLPELDRLVPASLRREAPPALPEVSEPEVVRHYTRLSQRNFSVDTGFYPLGSCTMKYNPKVHEEFVSLPGFSRLHPYQPAETVQGALRLMWELEQWLCEISGLHRATFQPAAGAHGELTGLMLIKAYHAAHAQPGAPPRDESSSRTRPTGPTRPAPAWPATGWWRSPPIARGYGPGRPPPLGGPPHRRAHVDQPQHPGPLRREHPGDRRPGPRGGGPSLLRRGQHQRHPGHLPPGRHGL